MTVTALTDTALELGEGVRLVGDRLVLVDILQGSLYEHPGTPGGALTTLASLDVPLGAVAPVRGRPNTWIAAAGDGIAVLNASGRLDWLARPEARHDGATRMNDGVCDPAGRFWAGSMAYDGQSDLGALYRVDPGGEVHQVVDGLAITNGPAFTPDGRTMFLADSGRRTVTRYDVDTDGRPARPRQIWAEAEGLTPDGMTVDPQGHLWCAVWGGAALQHLSPDGEPLRRVALPARQPTSLALAGDRAYVTTARIGLDDPGAHDGLLLAVGMPGATGAPVIPTPAFG